MPTTQGTKLPTKGKTDTGKVDNCVWNPEEDPQGWETAE